MIVWHRLTLSISSSVLGRSKGDVHSTADSWATQRTVVQLSNAKRSTFGHVDYSVAHVTCDWAANHSSEQALGRREIAQTWLAAGLAWCSSWSSRYHVCRGASGLKILHVVSTAGIAALAFIILYHWLCRSVFDCVWIGVWAEKLQGIRPVSITAALQKMESNDKYYWKVRLSAVRSMAVLNPNNA